MTTQTKTLMTGTATLNLMADTNDSDRFKRLLDKEMIIDARINFLTVEGETVSVSVMEFLELNWNETCPETGELVK